MTIAGTAKLIEKPSISSSEMQEICSEVNNRVNRQVDSCCRFVCIITTNQGLNFYYLELYLVSQDNLYWYKNCNIKYTRDREDRFG